MKIHLTDKDFSIDWYSGQGAGGQHRNKHQNCCRVTHIESGIITQGTESRSREENKARAYKRMIPLLEEWYGERHRGPIPEISDERIRTYHAERNEVIDHASGLRKTYKEVVIDGDIGDMIEARKYEVGPDI